MVSHEDRKKERMVSIISSLKKGKKKEVVIANCILEWGMSRRTVLEYIKVIETVHGKFN